MYIVLHENNVIKGIEKNDKDKKQPLKIICGFKGSINHERTDERLVTTKWIHNNSLKALVECTYKYTSNSFFTISYFYTQF